MQNKERTDTLYKQSLSESKYSFGRVSGGSTGAIEEQDTSKERVLSHEDRMR